MALTKKQKKIYGIGSVLAIIIIIIFISAFSGSKSATTTVSTPSATPATPVVAPVAAPIVAPEPVKPTVIVPVLPVERPCSQIGDNETNIGAICYAELWKGAGCTTQTPVYGDWHVKQSKAGLREDSRLWATLPDEGHQKGCYGRYIPPAPVATGGTTTVQLCSPWLARECVRAGPELTCAEFHACRRKYGQVPCGGDPWYNKCGWG